VGWPVPRGGSRSIAAALTSYLRALGGEVVVDTPVTSLGELSAARTIVLDVTPRQLLRLAGGQLPFFYRKQLERYKYGLGTFKVDWALDGPIPWRAPACRRTATVHLGGTLDELEQARRLDWQGRPAQRPYVLLAQPSLFDPTRAPEGKHVAWAYCHLPFASTADMTARIEAQIERFAPGFRDRILARHTMTASQMEAYNPNYVGGDINGGLADLLQLFTRPLITPNIANPYATPAKGLYLCSSSTPPGGGVHGMCGYFAASAALRDVFGQRDVGLHADLAQGDPAMSENVRDEQAGEDARYTSGAGKERAG
ncbi:MAG TPA: NAD(P)/FAD-dependent oxidoreductase, partial [Ktedonobacterales bacterium]|nr:NAD(P)/FAD-dependent oxidoreductase [Ktedonobacterales bacterium]